MLHESVLGGGLRSRFLVLLGWAGGEVGWLRGEVGLLGGTSTFEVLGSGR